MLADVPRELCYQNSCCMFHNVQWGRPMFLGAIWAHQWPCHGCIACTCIMSCLRHLQIVLHSSRMCLLLIVGSNQQLFYAWSAEHLLLFLQSDIYEAGIWQHGSITAQSLYHGVSTTSSVCCTEHHNNSVHEISLQCTSMLVAYGSHLPHCNNSDTHIP